jgi:GT2 family glycosyltransferase
VIVVDNGSPSPFRGANVIRSEANRGFGGGCNLGIRAALDGGATQVLLVNSDAEVAPDCVGRLEAALAARPDVGLVGPMVVQPGPPALVESWGIRFWPASGRMRNLGAGAAPEERPLGLVEVDAPNGCCLLARRQVFERAGLFAEELFYGFEELELGLRAARAGFRSAVDPSATVMHLGARTIGAGSPDRLYYAARNHLRVARESAPLPLPAAWARAGAIVAMNVAHALVRAPAPRGAGLRAVARGVYDHVRGRYGAK